MMILLDLHDLSITDALVLAQAPEAPMPRDLHHVWPAPYGGSTGYTVGIRRGPNAATIEFPHWPEGLKEHHQRMWIVRIPEREDFHEARTWYVFPLRAQPNLFTQDDDTLFETLYGRGIDHLGLAICEETGEVHLVRGMLARWLEEQSMTLEIAPFRGRDVTDYLDFRIPQKLVMRVVGWMRHRARTERVFRIGVDDEILARVRAHHATWEDLRATTDIAFVKGSGDYLFERWAAEEQCISLESGKAFVYTRKICEGISGDTEEGT